MKKTLAHYEGALAFCRSAGYRPDLAWMCCDYANLLGDRHGPGGQVSSTDSPCYDMGQRAGMWR